MQYIATFFSHFGTVRFKKLCDSLGIPARAMPVPRAISSSCGSCVSFEAESVEILGKLPSETESIVICRGQEYEEIFRA